MNARKNPLRRHLVRRNLVALAVAAVLGTGPLADLAHAADAPQGAPATAGHADPAKSDGGTRSASADDASRGDPAQNDPSNTRIIRTVDEARQAVQDIHAARLAIFEGMTDDAAKLVKDAVTNLDDAQSSLASLGLPGVQVGTGDQGNPGNPAGQGQAQASARDVTGDRGASGQGGQGGQGDVDGQGYLPFDTSISLFEGFVPQAEHQQALQQAGKQMQRGDQKGAADALHLADIELSVSAAMIPAKSSLDQVRQADELIGQQKWQEANLALKAVEDSIVVGSWDYSGVPDQGVQPGSAPQQGAPADAGAPAQNG